MQTSLPLKMLDTPSGKAADKILRSCVHCGFCTATCPTFLATGNELDSPRGRIYLIKEMLESGTATRITQTHLDRCLSCQSCETTCPSNVQYHALLNIGRGVMEASVGRGRGERIKRGLLLKILGTRWLFGFLAGLGKSARFLLPKSLRRQLPGKTQFPAAAPTVENTRKMVLLDGCVQESLSPDTNRAAALVLNKLGIAAVSLKKERCCGALHFHSQDQDRGLNKARQLLDQLTAEIAGGAEAIISTASGCGNFIKDYGELFAEDRDYAPKAETVSAYIKDISEVLQNEDLEALNIAAGDRLVFHSPCTLQHGQQLGGVPEVILLQLGFTLDKVNNSHLCCGSAGTYSLLQRQLARTLRREKIRALEEGGAERIATANIGCQCHLAAATDKTVKHWIEYVAAAIAPGGTD